VPPQRKGDQPRSHTDAPTHRDPAVHSGDEVFTGTRVPVETLFDLMRHGGTCEEFLSGFPGVMPWQVEAVLQDHEIDADLQPIREDFLRDLRRFVGETEDSPPRDD